MNKYEKIYQQLREEFSNEEIVSGYLDVIISVGYWVKSPQGTQF